MYSHDEEVVIWNYTSDVLNDVHMVALADLIIQPVLLITACTFNIGLLAFEAKKWRRTRTVSLPRLLIIWLASIDAVCALLGLLPRVLTLAIKPCAEAVFLPVHIISIFAQGFSILMSKFTVVVMGCERFASILAPFFYVRACSKYKFGITEIALGIYSLSFASIATFLNYFQYEDTHMRYGDIDHGDCHDLFLLYEFGSVDHEVEFPWRYSEIGGMFQFFQLIQDMMFVIIIVLCNSAVIRGLKQMSKRLAQILPKSIGEANADNSNVPDGEQRQTSKDHGKEFSRLITTTNIVVILLTTPQMVRNMCNYLHIAQSYLADYICHRVALCSACVNPIIYGVLRDKVRRKFRLIVLRILSFWRINNKVRPGGDQRTAPVGEIEAVDTVGMSECRNQRRRSRSLDSVDLQDTRHMPEQDGVF